MMSLVKPSTNCSHHFCLLFSFLVVQSVISNFDNLQARYNTAIAIISGSHCKHSVVQ